MASLTSKLLAGIPGVAHGFGSRSEPIPCIFQPSWERLRPNWKQIHGTAVSQVSIAGQSCGEVDALYCREPGLPIAIVTADCVPILLASRHGNAVAAVHAGWRGTRAHILRKLWDQLARDGADPRDWVAAIGPAIGPCCYEVSEELADDFRTGFSFMDPQRITPRHRHLDLPAINAAELFDIGLKQVDLLRACTQCGVSETGDYRFFSFRREGRGTRQWSMISLSSTPGQG